MFKFIYVSVVCLLFSAKAFGNNHDLSIKYDSVVVKTEKPSKIREQETFKEIDLSFAKVDENKDPGLWERFWAWLANLIFGKADHNTRANLQKIFIWTFSILGLALAAWLFSRSEFSTFLKSNAKNSEFSFTDIEEDFAGIDFTKKIEQAKSENDFRLAIRWLYLKQLFLLNEKNRIVWQPYKTNMDYLNELSKSNYRQSFKDISRIYEYVWYGKYTVDRGNFDSLEESFKQFESSINV